MATTASFKISIVQHQQRSWRGGLHQLTCTSEFLDAVDVRFAVYTLRYFELFEPNDDAKFDKLKPLPWP